MIVVGAAYLYGIGGAVSPPGAKSVQDPMEVASDEEQCHPLSTSGPDESSEMCSTKSRLIPMT